MCGPGHSGDFVNTAPVPPGAKNKAFQLDHSLRAVGDWRGDMAAPRNSQTYNVASSVVAAAYRMAMRESASKTEILDRDWKTNREVLNELLADVAPDDDKKKSQIQYQAEAITLLANHCKTGTSN